MKTCRTCKQEKALEEFSMHTTTKDRRRPDCCACRLIDHATWRTRLGKEGRRARYRYRTYGETSEQLLTRWRNQSGGCAICKKALPLDGAGNVGGSTCVDHDHRSGLVRGLLCNKCNTSLGGFQDTVEGLQRAIDYLKATQNAS